MSPNAQVFFDFTTTLRTFLRCPSSINYTEKLSSLPTHILDEGSKLTKRARQHMFPQHSFSASAVIQIFHEDHITSVAKSMSLLEVEIFPGVIDSVMKSRNFETLLLVVLRPPLFPRKSALQQFQLALQLLKKPGRFYLDTVTGC